MSSRWAQVGLLTAICLLVFFTNLGGPKLWDLDEPRNAGCAVEMMQANDWVVPRFNAELRTHKPVMLYWMMISSYSVFGVNEFSARIWSALLGTLTVLLTYDMGRRLFGHRTGVWAGVCLATTIMFTIASRAATPDAPLIFFVALGMWMYVVFSFADASDNTASAEETSRPYYPQRWWQVALLYGVLGLAVLSKGPVGLVLPTAVMGMFLLIQRLPATTAPSTWLQRASWLARPFAPLHFLKTVLFMRPILALVACLAVALPWYLWVAARDFRWIEGFFLDHNFGRATRAFEGHSGPPYYYLVAICIGFFPWSVFFSPLAVDLFGQLRRKSKEHAAMVFCCCWVGVWLGAFTIAQTKLPSYITPLFPGLALIMGHFVRRVVERRTELSPRWFDFTLGLTAFIGVAMTFVLVIVAGIYVPGEEAMAAIGLILVAGGITALWLKRRQQDRQALQVFGGMSALFLVAFFAFGAQRVSEHQAIDELLAKVKAVAPQSELCSFGVIEPTWVYYAGQPVHRIDGEPAEFEARLAEGGEVIFLTTPEKLQRLPVEMQRQLIEVARVPYFLKKFPIVALRPTPELIELAADRSAMDHQR